MRVGEILCEGVSVVDIIKLLDSDVRVTYEVSVPVVGGKKNPFQGRVTKVVNELPVHLTRNEEAYVKARQDAGAEDFNVGQGERKGWGNRTDDGLIHHDGKVYVQYIGKGRGLKSEYYVDGQVVDASEIQGLPDSQTKSDILTGVVVRRLNIASILSIKPI